MSTQEFYKLVKTYTDRSAGNCEKLAHEADVSVPTVRRWANGTNAPYRTLRPLVIQAMVRLLLSEDAAKQ